MLHDLKVTIRRLNLSRTYALTTIAILAMGAGVTLTLMSTVYALRWKEIDLPDARAVLAVSSVNARGPRVTPVAALRTLESSDVSSGPWCAYQTITEGSEAANGPMDSYVAVLSGDCADVLGVEPILGRWFNTRDVHIPGPSSPVALISSTYWRRGFGRDPNVIGRTIKVFNATLTVIGVLPESFPGLSKDMATDIFVPFNGHRPASNAVAFLTRMSGKDSETSVRAKALALWPDLIKSAFPPGSSQDLALKELRPYVRPAAQGFSRLRDLYATPATNVALVSVALLLVIALNVAGVFVARWHERQNEIGTMRALGAGTWRIARLVLIEASVLVSAGFVVGIAVAIWGTTVILRQLPADILAYDLNVRPDERGILAVVAAALILVVVISSLPIWRLNRPRVVFGSQRTATNRITFLPKALIVVQVALTTALVFTAILIARSLQDLKNRDLGVRTDGVTSARLNPNPGGYENLVQANYFPQLMRRLGELPGVTSVGAARYFSTIDVVLTSGQPVAWAGSEPVTNAFLDYVTPSFFQTVGTPILYGRDFSWADLPTSEPVAIVSESVVKALGSRGPDVLGRTITLGTGATATKLTVIGVVANISLGSFRQADHRLIFRSGVQSNQATMSTLHLRSNSSPAATAEAVTKTLAEFDREHVAGTFPLERFFENSLVAERLGAGAGLAEALLAVLVSCLGLFALISEAVLARTKEIGVRLVLGANASDIARSIVGSGLILVALGIAVGYPIARVLSRLVESLLFDIAPNDITTFAMCALLLTIAATIAAVIPARRTIRVDPSEALRQL